MLNKAVTKYPILIIGIILFCLSIFSDKSQNWWSKYTQRFKPNICQDALIRAEKEGPKKWKLKCNEQELVVSSTFSVTQIKPEERKRSSYRELANELSVIAKTSNPDTMKLIGSVVYHLETEEMTIIAYTSGMAIVKLLELTNPKAIAFHIHTSVKVKEILK